MVAWLQLWRDEHVELRSPLASTQAQERLALATGARGGQTVVDEAGDDSGFVVVGTVTGPNISLYAGRAGVRNAWRPVLRAHVVPSDPGCLVTGQLGWQPRVRRASLLWLVADIGLAVAGVVKVIKADLDVDRTGALRQLPLPVAAIGFGGLFVALTIVASSWGRKDIPLLREWLHATLANPANTPLLLPSTPIVIDLTHCGVDLLNTRPGELLSVPVG